MKDWRVYTDGYYYPHLHIVENIDEHKHETVAVIPRGMARDEEENMRKAQLIAAAPKMLEKLKGVLNIVEDSTGVVGYNLNGVIEEWDNFDEITEIRELVQQLEGDNS